jgi:hypothetical protein
MEVTCFIGLCLVGKKEQNSLKKQGWAKIFWCGEPTQTGFLLSWRPSIKQKYMKQKNEQTGPHRCSSNQNHYLFVKILVLSLLFSLLQTKKKKKK